MRVRHSACVWIISEIARSSKSPKQNYEKPSGLLFLLNFGARLAQHRPVLLREGNLPSRHPITATSLTAAVVVNKRQASSVLQHYCCKATRAQNTDDAQTASHSSRSRQATPLRVGADSAADADLGLFITLGCTPPSFFSFTSSPSLAPSLVSPCSFSWAKLSLATL